MSRVRTGGSSRTVGAGHTVDEAQVNRGVPVLCSGHHRKAQRFVATTNKNAGRAFYTCPKGREDADRCKFFVWEDELNKKAGDSAEATSASRAAQITATINQTGGRRLGSATETTTPTANRLAASSGMITPQTTSRQIIKVDDEDVDDIAWEKVDTDTLEADAIASTPSTSQKMVESVDLPVVVEDAGAESFTDRLRSVQDSSAKRKREETESASTSKRSSWQGESNPFISSSPGRAAPHAAMTETLTTLEKLSNELHRRDRLLTAAESAKLALRKTIEGLQKRNTELESRVAELEQQLRR